jgi:S-adenosylmethionine hydrolase
MAPVITLLTDFGNQDGYVGVMKGVIVSICPAARLIDLTHIIPPQDLAAARFTLLTAYPYFPAGTVHLVVVDPGVGTSRRAIALQTTHGYLVGPDNGVLSGVMDQTGVIAAVVLTNADYWRSPTPSTTFHGRDIFAPVAAAIANGTPLENLGEPLHPDALVRLAIPEVQVEAAQVTGHVQHIDHFGNIITTIPAAIAHTKPWIVQVGPVEIPVGQTYSDVARGEAIALVGSHGWLEIAVHGGSAQALLQLAVGDPVRLQAAQ